MRVAHYGRLALTLALAPALFGGVFVRADDDSPEALLKAKGLTRTRTLFSHPEKEAPVLEALHGLEPLAEAMKNSFAELSDAMAIEQRFRDSNETEANLAAEIDRVRIQLSGLPNNRQAQSARTQLQDYRRTLEFQRTEAVKEIKSTRPLRKPPQRLDTLTTRYQAANKAYYDAATRVTSSLREIADFYRTLAADSSVKAALGAYGRTSKTRVAIGRSRELQDGITWKNHIEAQYRPVKPQPPSQSPHRVPGKPRRRR